MVAWREHNIAERLLLRDGCWLQLSLTTSAVAETMGCAATRLHKHAGLSVSGQLRLQDEAGVHDGTFHKPITARERGAEPDNVEKVAC